MNTITRNLAFQKFFPNEPRFRIDQINQALFIKEFKSWNDVFILPKNIRDVMVSHIPWKSYTSIKVINNKAQDTYKAVLEMYEMGRIETVLMKNARDYWTICVSSQIGCAMRCTFCATGKMGFKRNLTADEIVDQYRFWIEFLREHEELHQTISNIVFMGMGEPLANYENVKEALNIILKNTQLGPTNITVSTVGLLLQLEKMLLDSSWPHVRIAISLHSSDIETRKKIVPTSYDQFLDKLKDWAKCYLKKFWNKRHHLTFEYVMLADINDTDEHVKALIKYVKSIGKIKVNLIPYNFTGNEFRKSDEVRINYFLQSLKKSHIPATRRKTMGDDIAAACGQLIIESKDRN